MNGFRGGFIIFVLLPFTAGASTFLFQGTLTADDQTAGISFTLNSTASVTIQSYGYAGGIVNSTTIASGGFDPNAYVFDNTGTLVAEYSGSGCVTGNDPITGFCDDPIIQNTFAAGQYAIVLTVANNTPNDSVLADGFVEDGAGPFTCAPFGETGNFCDVSTATGTPRTGNWAVAITGADSASLPEPGGWVLMAMAGVAIAVRRRRAASHFTA